MKTLFYRPILSAIALLFVANAATSQVTVKERVPLLEVRSVAFETSLAPGNFVTYTSQVLAVYRDGWTSYSFLIAILPTAEPFGADIMEGTLPAAFQALGQGLAANHVGLQSGNCDVDGAGNYEAELTWYSRVNRIKSLKVGSAFRPVVCSDEVKNLFRAVGEYAAALRSPG